MLGAELSQNSNMTQEFIIWKATYYEKNHFITVFFLYLPP